MYVYIQSLILKDKSCVPLLFSIWTFVIITNLCNSALYLKNTPEPLFFQSWKCLKSRMSFSFFSYINLKLFHYPLWSCWSSSLCHSLVNTIAKNFFVFLFVSLEFINNILLANIRLCICQRPSHTHISCLPPSWHCLFI